MKRLVSVLVLATLSLAMASTPTADALVSAAAKKGKAEGKNVLVVFHASWCGWCKTFDKFMDTTDEGKLVKSGLEVVHITVLESANKKADENPGGFELLKALGGDEAGLPFMAILDAKTKKPIINSLQKDKDQSTNTGYPAAPGEIAHFITMLEKGAPKLDATKRNRVKTWLTEHAPKN